MTIWQTVKTFWFDKPAWVRASCWFLFGVLFMGLVK